jgi:hypothetical protein
MLPTILPTKLPTILPTMLPTILPTMPPALLPTMLPTILPTMLLSPTWISFRFVARHAFNAKVSVAQVPWDNMAGSRCRSSGLLGLSAMEQAG